MTTENKEFTPATVWHSYMTTGRAPEGYDQPWFESPNLKPIIRRLPSEPRCRLCLYPFQGVGGTLSRRILGIEPSRLNPQMCNVCERFAGDNPGGAEVEMSLLFADMRGSTSIAENMSAYEFSRLIDRFYKTVSSIIFNHGGMLENLVGDEVVGFFVPGFAGENHARAAIETAREVLSDTGHGTDGKPWAPIGIGIHTGDVYVGAVGEKDKNLDITILGDNVNTAARLVSAAGTGEIVISDVALRRSGLTHDSLEFKSLELKGKENPVDAWVDRSVAPVEPIP